MTIKQEWLAKAEELQKKGYKLVIETINKKRLPLHRARWNRKGYHVRTLLHPMGKGAYDWQLWVKKRR